MIRRKPQAIIFDLDGTLCDCEHRVHFMRERPKRREEFHSACVFDKVVPACKALIDMAEEKGIKVILLSARPARFKPLTEEWLTKNNIHYDQLILSHYPELSDPDYKLKMYRELIEPFTEVLFTVDDRDSVVQMWRDNAITCLDIAGNHFS